MPNYTYKCENEKCEKCHIIVEQARKVDDRNKEELCECGKPLVRVTALTSQPVFRGGGFTEKFYR